MSEIENHIAKNQLCNILKHRVPNFIAVMDAIWEEPFILLENNEKWIFYSKELGLFFLVPSRLSKSDSFEWKEPFSLDGIEWNLPDEELFAGKKIPFNSIAAFLERNGVNNSSVLDGDRYFWTSNKKRYNVFNANTEFTLYSYNTPCYIWPVFKPNEPIMDVIDFIAFVFTHGFKILSLEQDDFIPLLKEMIQNNSANLDSQNIIKAQSELERLRKGNMPNNLAEVCRNLQKNDLLESDKTRADIEPYDEKVLTDPNRGHWDIWGETEEEFSSFIARDPRKDVRDNGVVGIDFGTTSTVVVYQCNDENIMPMRVGTGELKKSLSQDQYENPTIIELISYDGFMEAYKKGFRPQTQWEDLKISHQANQDFAGSAANNRYASFFANLKQWAGSDSKKNDFILRDQQGNNVLLHPYDSLTDEDFDPIEIYAYYLGLYINNMRNGIFLEYYLSFPVTYEKTVQNRIVKSFERGLKKSLPPAIVNDEKLMQRFCVDGSISEPAAYAVCALQEYGFIPEGGKKIYYGIFDFGGGTTDFDFGEWSVSEKRKYDFKVAHFGAQGDKFLGGENLLEMLAFNIFKKKENAELLVQKDITFTLPQNSKKFAGSDMLISNSSEAVYNMKSLMEKLRPIWENSESEESAQDLNETGEIKVNLLHSDGTEEAAVGLKTSHEELNALLREKIDSGIKQFFTAFEVAFYNRQDKNMNMDKIYILLAGNSSKSHLVKELFELHIQNYEKEHQRENLFELLPPIGSEEFIETKEKLQLSLSSASSSLSEYEKPTGKTGVAFGLIMSRKGGRIEVENKNVIGEEIPFKFYLGYMSLRRFQIIDESGNPPMQNKGKIDIGPWYNFIDVEQGDNVVEVYFTSRPEAIENNMDISLTQKVRCYFPSVDSDGVFYIRAKDPHTIEYTIGTANKPGNNVLGTVSLEV